MRAWQQTERRIRSRILAYPFVLSNLLTRYEIHGREHLLAALERQQRNGNGIITISNHQSLFDDPIVLHALLGIPDFTVESKIWWSTPCESNFSPKGHNLSARCVQYFSDVSNMVFFARPTKKNKIIEVPDNYQEVLWRRGGSELMDKVSARARAEGMDSEAYLRSFVTAGSAQSLASLNQAGMIEACARIDSGDWLHFFPEGGRSRTGEPRRPRHGVGKVLYHSRDAIVVPFCFCGMQDVLPISALVPRPMKRVVVKVGEPVPAWRLEAMRRGEASQRRFSGLADVAWDEVEALWPEVQARYLRQAIPAPRPRRELIVESQEQPTASDLPRAVALEGLLRQHGEQQRQHQQPHHE
jgi:1-acyl-sn-glycerol-3-phosphate acyltransferase